MRTQDIFKQLLREQEDDDDNLDFLDAPDPEDIEGNNDVNQNPVPDLEDGEEEQGFLNPPEGADLHPVTPKKPKLTEAQKIKMKWKEQNPGLTDQIMDDTIEFFNRRKNGLREYKDPPPAGYVNLPEIRMLAIQFPNLIPMLSDRQKIRDLQNYPWAAMELYMDRVGTEMATSEMDFTIEGDTPEAKKASAYKKWDRQENRIVDEGNIRVFRITGKDESIGLGLLQHILVKEAQDRGEGITNNFWCITNGPADHGLTNMYTTYRDRRSYYFVLDKNKPETDPYYLSTIEPVDPTTTTHRSELPYCVTPRPNGTRSGITWKQILDLHGGENSPLKGKEDLFIFFGTTPKERTSIRLDQINFRKGDPNSFIKQKLNIQRQYVESGRLINDLESFSVLPYDKENSDRNLRKMYIALTSLEDYKNRFRCNGGNPFGILDLIKKENPGLYTFLDEVVLKNQLGIAKGVWGIKAGILNEFGKRIMDDESSGASLFMSREKTQSRDQYHKYGVVNIDANKVLKSLEYIMGKPRLYMAKTINDQGMIQRKIYTLQMYTNLYSAQNDYFYFLSLKEAMADKGSRYYMKGRYFDGPEGDQFIQEQVSNGKLTKI